MDKLIIILKGKREEYLFNSSNSDKLKEKRINQILDAHNPSDWWYEEDSY